MRSFFTDIPAAKPDPILGVTEAFRADTSPNKVNLGVGVYQNALGAMPILNCVKEAASLWISQEDTKTYLPIDGVATFNSATQINLFGADSPVIKEKRATTVQCVGGSGALKLGAEFLKSFFSSSDVYVSDPTWDNHQVLFGSASLKVSTYPYYDSNTCGLKRDTMLEALHTLPSRSVVLLHACCHNPTGVDLTPADWEAVAEICEQRGLIPFIDMAYQGFAESLEQDAYAVRLFAQRGLTYLVSNSYAKSFSVYRERAGAITVVTASSEEATRVNSQLKRLVRTIYSSPPSYGAQLISLVLNTPRLKEMWLVELAEMKNRILDMRALFVETLRSAVPDRDFSFILQQRGMFSYSGLSSSVIREIRSSHNIYALESGRICVAAMNENNMEYVCNAIAAALKKGV